MIAQLSEVPLYIYLYDMVVICTLYFVCFFLHISSKYRKTINFRNQFSIHKFWFSTYLIVHARLAVLFRSLVSIGES
jgi:hypothetical protein